MIKKYDKSAVMKTCAISVEGVLKLLIVSQCLNLILLRFHIALKKIFSNSTFLTVIEKCDKSAVTMISAVFGTL